MTGFFFDHSAVIKIAYTRKMRRLPNNMSIGGIYIGPRTLITFSAELLWLGLSTVFLVIVNCASLGEPLTLSALIFQTTAVVSLYMAIFYVMDLYDSALMSFTGALLLNLVQATGILLVIVGVVTAGTHVLNLNPRLMIAHTLLTVLFVLLARLAIQHSSIPANPSTLLGIVARDPLRRELTTENERRKDLCFDFLWIGDSLEKAYAALAVRGQSGSYPRKILVDPELLDSHYAVQFLGLCREQKISIEELRFFSERAYGKVILGADTISDFATSRMLSLSGIGYAGRRTRDLILACFALIVTLPVTLLTMLAIKLDSSGPAIYTQVRIGENQRPFTMFKFRSMYVETAASDEASSWSTGNADPRVTRVGKIMRELHLDELPQLINVIRGEMSLVGPRPFHPLQVDELKATLPHFGLRHLVKPGITGWAQVRCDYAASVEDRSEVFARDLYYVKHASFLFDFQIMLETMRVCAWRRLAR
ncbi:MAG: sugar transferase [Candidatus Binataceae bacterium]